MYMMYSCSLCTQEQLNEKALNDNAYVNRKSFDYILITKKKNSSTPRQSTKPTMTNIVWLILSKNLAGINLKYLYLLYQETLFQVTRTCLKLRKVEYNIAVQCMEEMKKHCIRNAAQ